LTAPALVEQSITIAVIDSGVNVNHPHICAPTHGVLLNSGDAIYDSFEDTVGHGTAVMAAIQEKVPDAEYFAVKLFGSTLRASSAQLMKAIEWAIERRIAVVNLSLGTPNFDFREPMKALVERARESDVILVAARNAGPNMPVLPGSLDGVISVDVDWNIPRDQYRVEHNVFFASGYPRSLPGVPPGRNLNGVSFAVANMTAFVARVCKKLVSRKFQEVHDLLATEASI
jgi:subtilisin family serine protease